MPVTCTGGITECAGKSCLNCGEATKRIEGHVVWCQWENVCPTLWGGMTFRCWQEQWIPIPYGADAALSGAWPLGEAV